MQDLDKVIQSYSHKDILLISDYHINIVANEILKTVRMLQRWNLGSWSTLDHMILDEFNLDINHNCMHMIMWENWMKFISDLDIIDIEIRLAYPSSVFITDDDICYLENLSKE